MAASSGGGKGMKYAMKNTLFVRNLSPNISEGVLREVFGQCDTIEEITFRPFSTTKTEFFAQIDFKTSKGVTEGIGLSGVDILGVACACGVLNPAEKSQGKEEEFDDLTVKLLSPEQLQAEYLKRLTKAEEEQRMRTVHIAGLERTAGGVDPDALRNMCASSFGEVKHLKIDTDANGAAFALVEFVDQGAAQVCKLQKKFLVDGQVWTFTEAQTMVDEASAQERSVHFEAPMINAVDQRTMIEQSHLGSKLAQVMAAAKEISKPGGAPAEGEAEPGEKKKKKKTKEEKKKKKKKKKEKKKKKKEDSESEEDAVSIGDDSSGPVDLDEVEVMASGELVVMGEESSSSESTVSLSDVEPPGPPVELDIEGTLEIPEEPRDRSRSPPPVAVVPAPPPIILGGGRIMLS